MIKFKAQSISKKRIYIFYRKFVKGHEDDLFFKVANLGRNDLWLHVIKKDGFKQKSGVIMALENEDFSKPKKGGNSGSQRTISISQSKGKKGDNRPMSKREQLNKNNLLDSSVPEEEEDH